MSDSMGRYLTTSEARDLYETGQRALHMHHAAGWEAASQGELSWLQIPKMHLANHCNAETLAHHYNTRYWGNWQGEDFMGSLKKLCLGTITQGMELRVMKRCLLRLHAHKGKLGK